MHIFEGNRLHRNKIFRQLDILLFILKITKKSLLIFRFFKKLNLKNVQLLRSGIDFFLNTVAKSPNFAGRFHTTLNIQ